MARHGNDLAGAEALGRQHGAEADGSIADNGHGAAGRDTGSDCGMVSGREDVGEGQQVGHHGLIGLRWCGDEGSVGQRHAYGLALATVDRLAVGVIVAPEAASNA